MIQTTIICGGGIAIFGFSQFVPTSGFAWMAALLLAAALVGDLIVLPALLLSPLGKLSMCGDESIAATTFMQREIDKSREPIRRIDARGTNPESDHRLREPGISAGDNSNASMTT
jgi:hypothetical protein